MTPRERLTASLPPRPSPLGLAVPEPESVTVSWRFAGVFLGAVGAIATALSALVRIGRLIETLETLRAEVAGLREEVAALRKENVELSTALAHLQGSLGQ